MDKKFEKKGCNEPLKEGKEEHNELIANEMYFYMISCTEYVSGVIDGLEMAIEILKSLMSKENKALDSRDTICMATEHIALAKKGAILTGGYIEWLGSTWDEKLSKLDTSNNMTL